MKKITKILAFAFTLMTINTICVQEMNAKENKEQTFLKIDSINKSDKEIKEISGRFVKGDKTLKDDDIQALYYLYKVDNMDVKQNDYASMTDKYIKLNKFIEAEKTAELGISIIPIDLGLLSRVSELAQHNSSPKIDMYIWQMASIFHIISRTGDGTNEANAYKVRNTRDAYLYETLWLQTPAKTIFDRKEELKDGKKYIIFTIKLTPISKISKSYYEIVEEK